MKNKRFIVIESTKYIGKFSAYDTLTKREIPCHNLATARNVCKEMNKSDKYCSVCECDPCDCNDGCKDEEEYWKIWGDK